MCIVGILPTCLWSRWIDDHHGVARVVQLPFLPVFPAQEGQPLTMETKAGVVSPRVRWMNPYKYWISLSMSPPALFAWVDRVASLMSLVAQAQHVTQQGGPPITRCMISSLGCCPAPQKDVDNPESHWLHIFETGVDKGPPTNCIALQSKQGLPPGCWWQHLKAIAAHCG